MSYALYIGRNRSASGIAYLAGYGDEPSSHWLEIVPRQQHPDGAMITVGVTSEADLPGQLTDIAQVPQTARHIRVSYSYYKGVPAPLTNGGLNEHGVAVRDVWSSSRAELVALTPATQSGPNYSDLARIMLERATSARGAVLLAAELITRHGYSDYGGNSHLIADADEAWVLIECAGGAGLWAAERLGPDAIRASRPGHIGDIPVDQSGHPDFLYSANLVAFAQAKGWFDPGAGTPFNFNRVYGDSAGPWPGATWIEDEMARRASRPEKIGLVDMFWAMRTEKLTGDTAGYGQVVPLQRQAHHALYKLWHTPIGAIAAPFVPVFMGMQVVPEEYRQHRYLSAGEARRFMDMRQARNGRLDSVSAIPQGVESTRSAVQVFKQLLYLVVQHEELYLPEVTATWTATERRLLDGHDEAVATAATLLAAGRDDLAQAYLDFYCHTHMRAALDLGQILAQSLEARTRAMFGFSDNPLPVTPKQIW